MSLLELVLFAIGLSFDTFAVSVTAGYITNKIRFLQATRVAVVLGLFQALMPVLGWFLGINVRDFIQECDHWIAFGLLAAIGIKMVYESLKKEDNQRDINIFNPLILIGMAIATSIDAFVVGVSFALIEVNIWMAILIIFVTTYLFAMLGMLIGKKAGKWFGKKMEIIGGFILIGLGLKVLIEHLLTV